MNVNTYFILGLRDKTQLELSQESDGNLRDNDGESDCLSDRSAALDEQRVNKITAISIHTKVYLKMTFCLRPELKHYMYQNVQSMVAISECNVTDLQVIAGVYTKILVKIFRVLQLTTHGLNVIRLLYHYGL